MIYKAQPIGSESVPDLHLNATEPCPDGGSLQAANDLYRTAAREIVAALNASLPSGTMHCLLVELLAQRAKDLGVRRVRERG